MSYNLFSLLLSVQACSKAGEVYHLRKLRQTGVLVTDKLIVCLFGLFCPSGSCFTFTTQIKMFPVEQCAFQSGLKTLEELGHTILYS